MSAIGLLTFAGAGVASIALADAIGADAKRSALIGDEGGGVHEHDSWCTLPAARPIEKEGVDLRETTIPEVEPNNSPGGAQHLPLGTVDDKLAITGSISPVGDIDYFSVDLEVGDVLGVIVQGVSGYDTLVAITDVNGVAIVENDDDNHSGLYPAASPLPRTSGLNPNVSFIAPATQRYYLRVRPFSGNSTGTYTMRVQLYRPFMESAPAGERQIIFLDFDGAVINAAAIFGFGSTNANLSPMRNFLPAWGLTLADEDAVIDAVVDKVQEQFDKLLALNPSMDYEIRNSRDDADPWGGPFVTRVIIGGTQSQLGIGTVGIAQSIDPGNFQPAQTAVVLLDLLSSPSNAISANVIPRAAGVPILEAIKRGVGNIAAHEAGHTFGNWHTRNSNTVYCIMDSGGGNLRQNIYEAGPDGVIGNADDMPTAFTLDLFASEGVGNSGSVEQSDYRTAFALSTSGPLCPADLNGSGGVDGADLGLLLGSWGVCPAPCAADLNADGVVNGADLGLLLGAWGGC